MSAPKRRRWFSLSLRTLLISITLLSVVFAWFLHHRREKIAEKERLEELFQGSFASIEFVDAVFPPYLTLPPYYALPPEYQRFSEPDPYWWVRPMAMPTIDEVDLRIDRRHPVPDDVVKAACRSRAIEFHTGMEQLYPSREDLASFSGEEANDVLRRCLSNATRKLTTWCHAESLDFRNLSNAPYLTELVCPYSDSLDGESLRSIWTHPRLECLTLDVDALNLARMSISKPSNIRTIDLSLNFFREEEELAEQRKYEWIKHCPRLEELTLRDGFDASFLRSVGKHRSGVATLIVEKHVFAPEFADSLVNWRNLKHLWILDAGEMGSDFLSRVVESCPNLESLEISEGGQERGQARFSPAILASLQRLPLLRRLRLDHCGLSSSHILEITKCQGLREVSLTGNLLDDAAIQPLKKLRHLRMIDLDGNGEFLNGVSEEEFKSIRGDWRPQPRPICTQIIPIVG